MERALKKIRRKHSHNNNSRNILRGAHGEGGQDAVNPSQPHTSLQNKKQTSTPTTTSESTRHGRTASGGGLPGMSSEKVAPPGRVHLSTSQPPSDVGTPQDKARRKSNAASIAEDYKAYQPALDAEELSKDLDHMTLGGNTRLMTEPSTQPHNEDVADRNMSPNHNAAELRHASVDTANSNERGSRSLDSSESLRLELRAATKQALQSSAEGDAWALPDTDTQAWVRPEHRQSCANHSQNLVGRRTGRMSTSSAESSDQHVDAGYMARFEMPYGSENEDSGVALWEDKLEGVIDLHNTEDVDKTLHYASAVTHEVVRPHVHEIVEEQIHREIHNHDVYHYTLPVVEVEVLPARHFVPGPNGTLKEVTEAELPGCTGENQRWSLGMKGPHVPTYNKWFAELTARRAPQVIDEKVYMTPEGFPRTETTILHPPTLADVSKIEGPVLRVHFDEHGQAQELPIMSQSKAEEHVDLVSEMKNAHNRESAVPEHLVPPRKASLRKKSSKDLAPAHNPPPTSSMLDV